MSGKDITNTVTMQMSLGKTRRSYRLELQDLELHVSEGPQQGLVMPIVQDIIDIGRHEALCDLVLQDRSASARHARLTIAKNAQDVDCIRLQDLKSRNGVFLDGRRIRDVDIFPGDTFQVGGSTITLQRKADTSRSVEIQCFDDSGLLVGKSQEMRQIFAMIRRLEKIELPVLLLGETGTGKTTIAQAIHQRSAFAGGPFVSVNCGALSPTLIESSLFGHEAGAFTGAKQRHQGYFEQANGGTLFLDEIGELPLDLQPKLLDVIESQKVMRLGGQREIPLRFRLLSATHRDLAAESRQGRFREDLFYRLSVISMEVPPLRERLEDLPLLTESLLEGIFPELSPRLTPAAYQKLQSYVWPGNIRELHNVLARTFAFTDALMADADDIDLPQTAVKPLLPPAPTPRVTATADQTLQVPLPAGDAPLPLKEVLSAVERDILQYALERTDWNVQSAAHLLQINQSWLYKRIKTYELQAP